MHSLITSEVTTGLQRGAVMMEDGVLLRHVVDRVPSVDEVLRENQVDVPDEDSLWTSHDLRSFVMRKDIRFLQRLQ